MSADSGWDDIDEPNTETEEPELYYATLAEFVTDFLSPIMARDHAGGQLRWCPEWWRHPGAVYRLDALWRAWEHLRLDPATGASVWLRDHADPHMANLLSEQGPFKGCTVEGHRAERTLPLNHVPWAMLDGA